MTCSLVRAALTLYALSFMPSYISLDLKCEAGITGAAGGSGF